MQGHYIKNRRFFIESFTPFGKWQTQLNKARDKKNKYSKKGKRKNIMRLLSLLSIISKILQ